MKQKTLMILVVVLATFTVVVPADACTGIRLVANDGSPVFGRTMEFGAEMLHFNLIVVPRATSFQGVNRAGVKGKKWNAKYGFVAAIPYEALGAMEGINERGLQGGGFFFQPYDRARYMEPIQSQNDRTIASWQLLTWCCPNVRRLKM